MSEHIEFDGFLISISDKKEVTVCVTRDFTEDEIFVPLEINGIPIKKFYFSVRDISQKIKRIKIPASVELFVWRDVFYRYEFSYNIEIEIDEKNPNYFSDGKAVYTKDRAELIYFFARADEEYKIQDGCKTISENAFLNSKNLKRIFFPNSLKLICKDAFLCCKALTELNLPNGLTKIGRDAFGVCSEVKKISLPSTLESIEYGALCGSDNAVEIHLPSSLKELSEYAFSRNHTLILDPENENFDSRDGYILSKDRKKIVCLSNPPIDDLIIIPEYVAEIGARAFYNSEKIKKIVLPKGLHTIGEYAFAYMKLLSEINLENVKIIGESAFHDCESLERIRLNCVEIGKDAFSGCSNLTEAEIDCEMTGQAMFKYCNSLQKVTLKNTKVIAYETFCDTANLKEIVFPPELEIIKGRAFALSGLEPLVIPKTVRKLGNDIAEKIKEIHVYDNLESDICVDNDISGKDYTLFVHSAENGEIRYAVPIIGGEFSTGFGHNAHEPLVGMFKGGVTFDLKKFDEYFDSISDNYFMSKFNAGMIRLKDGYELDDEMRKKYEQRLDDLGKYIAEYYIEQNDIETALNPDLYIYMSLENLIPLTELSAQHQLTELTAFLLQICEDKRRKSGYC